MDDELKKLLIEAGADEAMLSLEATVMRNLAMALTLSAPAGTPAEAERVAAAVKRLAEHLRIEARPEDAKSPTQLISPSVPLLDSASDLSATRCAGDSAEAI